LVLTDLVQVIYAPQKAFKKIVANPKYLGAIIVLILFIGLQMGYEYTQLSKTNVEITEPQPGLFQTTTQASTGNWTSSSGAAISDSADYFNYTLYASNYGFYPNGFGNTSLQLSQQDAQALSARIDNAFNVDCSGVGFQNLSMVVKLVDPANAVPQNATLTLYNLNDNNYYTYDLTPQLSDASLIGQWNNLTIPIGPNSETEWTTTGNPTWNNITSIKLDLSYANGENATVRIGALFFRGQYLSLAQNDPLILVFSVLQSVSLQFLILWLAIAAIMYLVLKGLKVELVWKPIFVSVGIALIVMVIRSVLCIAATLALPQIYYPWDLSTGLSFAPYGVIAFPTQATSILSVESMAAFTSIEAASASYRAICFFLFGACYVWLGILCTFIVGAVKPELSMSKRILAAAVAVIVTVMVLVFLLLGYA
jgi:hypothetical protein